MGSPPSPHPCAKTTAGDLRSKHSLPLNPALFPSKPRFLSFSTDFEGERGQNGAKSALIANRSRMFSRTGVGRGANPFPMGAGHFMPFVLAVDGPPPLHFRKSKFGVYSHTWARSGACGVSFEGESYHGDGDRVQKPRFRPVFDKGELDLVSFFASKIKSDSVKT